MTILFGNEKLKELRKENYKYILLYVLPSLVFATIVALLFIYSSRQVKSVFPVILSIVTTIYVTYIMFISFILTSRHVSLMKKCKEVRDRSTNENDYIVVEIEQKRTTIDNIQTYGVHLKEIDTGTIYNRYIPIQDVSLLVLYEKYTIRTFHQFIVGIEEKNDE